MITVGSVMLSLLPKDGFTVENQQIASADLMSLSLEELMDVKVIVASKKEATLREAPGIITVVTAEEIAHSGARDLIDVLRLVPGYDFGVQLSNLVGVAIRGQWAMEGKVLLLIDGIEMNERRNASTEFGQHFPVEQISRIEIIRGPGSVMYGGSAELGVINIITKKAEELNGAVATASYGQLSKTFGHKNVNLMYGQSFDEIKVTAMGFAGRGHRSDREYKDGLGATVNMEDANELAPSFFNFGFQYKDFSARAIIDNYYNNNMDGLVKVRTQPTKIKMEVSSYSILILS
jgi:outer membrane receptor for ferrienterochelin and colicin